MIENLFTFVRTLGNQRIEGKKFFVTQVGLLGTVSDNTGSIGTAGKVLSSTGSGVQWITVGSSNVQNLNDLTDVVINTAVDGNLLRYNGTSWVNWAPNFLTSYGSLNDLSDVTLTTPVDGSRLVYVHSTGKWIDAAPLALNKIYYGAALGDSQTSTVVTNGTRLGVGTLAMATNLTVGQVDITDGLIGNGSVHIGGVNDNDTYLLASNNKIQVGSQETEVIPGEEGGEEPQTQTTFTPSTLNIQPLGGQTVFGDLVTATGFKTPTGIKKQILLADGTVSSTNAATSGQILRWIESGGIGQWVADDEGVSGIPSLQEVTDVGSTTTDTITAAGFSTAGSVTASTVTTPLIEREGILTINSEQQVDQGEPNPDLLYVSWLGDNKFVVDADGYAIATTGFKVVGGTSSGFLKADGTIDTSTYITSYTETQTLDDVTTLGSTTANTITVGGLTAPELNYGGLLTINADSDGGLQPQQGDPAVPVLSFEWAGNQNGYIDTDGKITFNGFKTPTGTSSGFLKANGTVDTSVYITGIDYLDDIADVILNNPANGDVLMYDGGEWINAQIQTDYTSKVQHEVKAGVAIAKGQAVYVTSADGTNMIVGLASNASEATSSKTMGLALTSAAVNGKFFVVTEGLIDGLNTASATAGQPVWLGVDGNLIFGLTNKPVAPAHLVYLGIVTRANANNGEIFVHVQNGFELNEIHDALITSPTDGQLLRRDSDGLWKNWTPDYITASSSDVLTNKRIELSTGITSATAIDSLDPFLGQNDIALYQDGIDKGGKINVLEETGEIVVSSAGIGYYSGLTTTEGGSRFSVTVAGNTLTGTLAEFNEALVDGDFATQSYVSTQIANLVDSAPATLNTLNELAAALGDDPNFATTVATSIGLKQDKLNGVGFVKANGTTITYDNSSYITSESDPVFTGSAAYNITAEEITSWNDAYGWGNHAEAGYLTTLPDHTHIIADVTGLQTALDGKAASSHTHSASDITSGTISTDRLPKQELGISIVGNFGQWQGHSTYQNLNTDVAYWGWNFVQGSTNAPHQSSSQWYRGRFSLGDEYGLGTSPGDYWMEIAIPRYNQDSTAGNLFVRTCENGSINAWQGVRAAFATDADLLDGQHGTYYQAASTAINTSNIGSQSVNYASTSGTSTNTYRGIIEDTRSGQRTPNDYDDYRVSFEFTNQMPHDSNWLTVMTMQGWHNGYAAWQIMGTATTTAYESWYLRSGVGTSWNTAKEIIHSGNIASQSVSYADESGYSASAGSVEWSNVQSKPATFPPSTHNHDSDYVNVGGDTMTGNLTLKYSTTDSSDYEGLRFSPYSDEAGLNDYIIKAASDKGVFGRKSFGWHVHTESAFGVYSNGWVQLFGVEGGTGNTQVFGNLTVSGSITESSSIRYKKDVVDIESASAKVEQLKPVRYKKIKDNQEEIGLIAEDVAELFPEVVKYDNEGRPDGVNYSRLSVILLKAVQELTERVNKLENK